MNEILYKTKPRLILSGGLFSGFFFSFVFILFCIQVSTGENKIIGYSFASIFALFSILCLYQLIKIRILKISENGIEIKKYLLPHKRNLKFEEIKTIKQTEEKTRIYPGVNMFEKGYLLFNYKTKISLKNSEKIELMSLSETDFYEVEKLFFKLKRGEGKIKKPEKQFSLFLFIFENIGTLIFIIIINILSIGLLIEIIKNSC
ncbi:MAG: hypothetical protein ACSHXA_17030 [Polaribacter sp.]|uniref:hypothetical protein n=1 Tax=Polaribacter sp. TaxID=1920175 RepID=UPI003EF810D1